MEQIKSWDEAAADYQRVFRMGLNDYNRQLLEFFTSAGLLHPGCSVLDIGCGVGKYGTDFAELGCGVTLTDISPAMLAHAARNMAAYATPWRIVEGDFAMLSTDELSGGDKFDLSVAMMSAAVHDTAGVEKMSVLTRGWCFTANFVEWAQPMRDEFYRLMGLEVPGFGAGMHDSAEALLQAVRDAGYDPIVKYVPYDWSDDRSPDEAAEYLIKRCGGDTGDAALMTRARKIAAELADENGVFVDSVSTCVAWIYWNTEA